MGSTLIMALNGNQVARNPRKDEPRGRKPTRTPSPGANRRRGTSPSPGRSLIDWGNKCFHCGSTSHNRDKCASFAKMLADAPHNKNKPKDKWSPPPGYKSALGKARDAARDAEKKKNGAMQAVTSLPTLRTPRVKMTENVHRWAGASACAR